MSANFHAKRLGIKTEGDIAINLPLISRIHAQEARQGVLGFARQHPSARIPPLKGPFSRQAAVANPSFGAADMPSAASAAAATYKVTSDGRVWSYDSITEWFGVSDTDDIEVSFDASGKAVPYVVESYATSSIDELKSRTVAAYDDENMAIAKAGAEADTADVIVFEDTVITATPASYTFPTIKYGATNSASNGAVAWVASALGLGSKTTFDDAMYDAVVSYQKANGLGVDGVVGKSTYAKLASQKGVTITVSGSVGTGKSSGSSSGGTGSSSGGSSSGGSSSGGTSVAPASGGKTDTPGEKKFYQQSWFVPTVAAVVVLGGVSAFVFWPRKD